MYGKKIIALALTLMMIISSVPGYAQNTTEDTQGPTSEILTDIAPDLGLATEKEFDESLSLEEYYDSGTLQNGVAWIAEYGMLTIGGTGDMPDFEIGDTPWYEGRESINFVYIAEGITSIGDYAFYDLINLKGIYISETVTSIGEGSFMQCSILPDIKLPTNLKTIESSAFKGCNNFKKVTIPEKAESIASDAYASCEALENFVVSEGNKNYTSVGGVLFSKDMSTLVTYPCGKTESKYDIPAGVKNISANAFEGCYLLEEVNFPDGLLTIEENAFTNCSGIETINIPASVTNIAQNAFLYGCDALKEINVNENNANYSSQSGVLFNKDKTTLIQFPSLCEGDGYGEYGIPAEVKVIGKEAFLNCSTIEYLFIYGGLEKIETAAFMGFDSLYEIWFEGIELRWLQIEKESFNEILDNMYIRFMAPAEYEEFEAVVGKTYRLDDYVTVDTSVLEYLVVNSSDPSIVSIDLEKMEMTAISEGEAIITATTYKDGATMMGAAKVTVTKEGAGTQSGVAKNLFVGDTADLKASLIIPDEYLDRFIWNSSNKNVATVEDGVITAVGKGTAVIIANTEDNRYSFKFDVVVEPKYTSEDKFIFSNGVITKYTGTDTEVSIPPTIGGVTVTAIGNDAFKGWWYGKKIEMPETITKIGKNAFSGCMDLKDIKLHEGITSIGTNAFFNCTGLVKMVIPSTVTDESGNNWFTGCINLRTVEFAYGTKTIARGVRYASAVRNIIIPSSVTDIGYSAFAGCVSLTSIVIPDSVTTIGHGVFSGCQALASVTLGKKVASVGSSCFENCSRLTTVKLGSALTYLSYRMFYRCTKLKSISVPKNVTTIENNAFGQCYALSDVTLVSGLKEIRMSAFADCTSLSTINIPSTVTSIGTTAFARSGLTEIVVPSSATLGYNVFADCYNLKKADISGSKRVPKGTFANCSTLKEIILNTGITAIEDNAFYGCIVLTAINIPDTVKTIGNYAFYNCRQLKNVTGLKGVVTVGDYAFYYCYPVTSLEFSNSLTSIGKYAFSFTKITEFVIPDSVTTLGECAFYACSSLLEITFGKGLKVIPKRVITGCSNVWTVNISEGITEISDEAFYDTTVRTVNIPDSVTRIGYKAFYSCERLTNINFGNGLKVIDQAAFDWCRNLEEVILPDSLEVIAWYAFAQCNSLRKLDLGDGVKELMSYAFSDCYDLYEVVIPDSVTTIGSHCFEYCRTLKKITFGSGLKSIGDRAFYGCNKLTFEGGISAALARYIMNSDVFGTGNFTIESYDYLNAENTGYTSTVEDFYTYIPMELKFSLKDEYENATNKKITINLPYTAYLINGTMELDGVPYSNYTEYENAQYGSNQINVNIADGVSEGVLTFCIKPTEFTTILTYAEMALRVGGYNRSEFLGFVNASLPNISISAPDTTGKADIIVEGLSKPKTLVNIYINDGIAGQVRTSSTGIYKTTVTIPNPENHVDYKVSAGATVNGEKVSAETYVKYINNTPSLEGLTMHYGAIGQKMTVYDLYNTSSRPRIRWGSYVTGRGYGYHYYFTVDISENSMVDKVYVVSTRDNKKQYLEAVYDRYTDKYVTTGYFDGNYEYIPGVLTVEYTRKNNINQVNTADVITYMNFEENIFTPVITEYTDNTYGATVNVDTTITSDIGDYINVSSKVSDREYEDISGEEFTSYTSGYYAYPVSVNGDKYILVYDLTDIEKARVVLHDISRGKQTEYTFAFAYNGEDDEAIYISPEEVIEKINSYAGKLLDIYNIGIDTDALMDKLRVLNANEDTIVEAFEKVKDLEIKKDMFLLASMAIGASTVGNVSAPVRVINPMYAALKADISYFTDLRILNLYKIGSECKIRWMIDPSGYVYEGVTDNRLEGVTTTAYCVPVADVVLDANGNLDESATNFANKVVWDAQEDDQQNPLITDINGEYKWDVPDGYWWQVEYKKDGYETAYSRWMPVPPVQTDVNIGLVSLAKPKVESIYLTADYLLVTFDKYMDPATVTDVTIGNASYTVEYDKSKTDLSGNNYAKEYTFRFNEKFLDGELVPISIKGAKSYAGTPMADYSVSERTPGVPLPNEIIITDVTANTADGSIKVDYFNNRIDEKITFDTICAIYDSTGELIAVQNITIEDFETGKKTDRTFTFAKPWSYYKIFSMSSISNLKPVIKPYDSRNAQ